MVRDLRFGLRAIARRPAPAAAIVAVLAVGTGAGTVVFAALNEALLRMPAGVVDPATLVLLERHTPARGAEGFTHLGFLGYRRGARSFSRLGASRPAELVLHARGEATAISARLVTEDYLPLLGVRMALGRHFLPAEERVPDAHAVLILSHRFWRVKFGGNPAVIGSSIPVNGRAFTVVGVAAPRFEGIDLGENVDVWLPLAMEQQARPLFPVLNSDLFPSLRVVGRLAPGVSATRARAELNTLARALEPGSNVRVMLSSRVGRADAGWRHLVISWALPLAVASGLLLALVIVNAAGILLATSARRRSEHAVRLALGAGRGRIGRQIVAETLLLTVPATALGLLVARAVGAVLRRRIPELSLVIDIRVLLFTFTLALAACCLAALAPALDASRRDLARELRNLGQRPHPQRIWRVLVAGQIALSLTLLTVALLMLRSARTESVANVGFEAAGLFLAELDLRLAGYAGAEALGLQRRLVDDIARVPGVRAVSAAGAPPIDRGFLWGRWTAVPDGAGVPLSVQRMPVAPGYFEVLGTDIVAGRGFTNQDDSRAPRVAVVNETMAARLRPGAALGRTLRFPDLLGPGERFRIVGITRDVRVASREPGREPEVLFPLAQSWEPGVTVLFRTRRPSTAVLEAVRDVIHRQVPELPPPTVESVRERRNRMLSDNRLYAELTGLFGLVGMFVATLGLYGVVTLDVGRRTHEFGVRLSLGAQPAQVRALLMRDEALLVAGGILAGLALSAGAGLLLRSTLRGVSPLDPVPFTLAAALLAAVAAVVTWLSARRISDMDPTAVLRST